MSTDIIVVGIIKPIDGGLLFEMDRIHNAPQQVVAHHEGGGSGNPVSSQPFAGNSNDANIAVAVNVSVADSNNLAKAQTAAENLAKTLAKLEAALNDIPPSTPIEWVGTVYTASQVLSILHNTKFIMSDQSDFGNGGVGSALIGAAGQPNVDTLNFRYFDGDMANSSYDYAAPSYTNSQGMTGIILHEVAHLTPVGAAWDKSAHTYYKREHGDLNSFNGSEYWQSTEDMANNFAFAAAAAINLPINEIGGQWYLGAIPPEQIYYDHMNY